MTNTASKAHTVFGVPSRILAAACPGKNFFLQCSELVLILQEYHRNALQEAEQHWAVCILLINNWMGICWGWWWEGSLQFPIHLLKLLTAVVIVYLLQKQLLNSSSRWFRKASRLKATRGNVHRVSPRVSFSLFARVKTCAEL